MVHAVFPTIIFSSVFPVPPTPLSITLILNHFHIIPLEARRFCGIVPPIEADGTNDFVVAHDAIVPLGQAEGIYTLEAQAPKTHVSHGDHINDGQSFTTL